VLKTFLFVKEATEKRAESNICKSGSSLGEKSLIEAFTLGVGNWL